MEHVLRSKKGFTLVELLVVIAIIGLLAGVVFAAVNPGRVRARDARRIADAESLRTANELFRDANNGNAAATLAALVTAGYLGRTPTDPSTGVAYTYANTAGTAATYYLQFVTEDVSTLGAAGTYCATSRGISGGACVEQ